MVSAREANRELVRELFGGDLLRAYRAVVGYGDTTVRFSKKQARRYIVHQLAAAGFDEERIARIVGIKPYYVRLMLKKPLRLSHGFHAALALFGEERALFGGDGGYACEYRLSKSQVEWLIVRDLLRAGWSVAQVVRATGFSRRRVDRIANQLKESDDDG